MPQRKERLSVVGSFVVFNPSGEIDDIVRKEKGGSCQFQVENFLPSLLTSNKEIVG